jgi:hypothetical protein
VEYAKYEDVPWYRREPGALVLLLAFVLAPVTIALCVIALTGDVYKKERDDSGKLRVWGVGNKVAAVTPRAAGIHLLAVVRSAVALAKARRYSRRDTR